jgi:hypothetical protein
MANTVPTFYLFLGTINWGGSAIASVVPDRATSASLLVCGTTTYPFDA